MSMERIKEAREALFAQLLADMEKGGMDWQKQWSFPAPHNPKTGTVYRGRNALMLTFYMRAHGLDDPRFMTFNQAKGEGYRVAKGCHSYPIEKWMKIAFDRREPDKRIRQPRTPKEWKAVEADPNMDFKFVVVGSWNLFNAKDIEGIAPYEPPQGIVGESELIDFLVDNSPCKVEERSGDTACYIPAIDTIVIPERAQFASDLSMGRVLLHEQSHATGAADRLDRAMNGRFGSEEYAREELTAELSSLFTANELGLSLPALGRDDSLGKSDYWQNHVAYLASWSKGFDNPVSELMQAASRAGGASDYLMDKCFGEPLARMRSRDSPARHEQRVVEASKTVVLSGSAPKRAASPRSLDGDLRAAAESGRAQRHLSFRRDLSVSKD